MSARQMNAMSFKELVAVKTRLRRRGLKDGVRYANIESFMKKKFGRT